MFRCWNGSLEKFRNPPRVRTELHSNAGVKLTLSPPPHFCTVWTPQGLGAFLRGLCVSVCSKCVVWCVLDAVRCLAPSPPTCHEIKGFRECLHGDGESQGDKILLGILFPPNPGSINQVLGEKAVTLPVSPRDITWNNSQTLPGQWERA